MILKGILLWSTILLVFCTLAGVESLTDKGLLFWAIGLCALMILLCSKLMTKDEAETLSLVKWFEKI